MIQDSYCSNEILMPFELHAVISCSALLKTYLMFKFDNSMQLKAAFDKRLVQLSDVTLITLLGMVRFDQGISESLNR